jgi:hypothetical protein
MTREAKISILKGIKSGVIPLDYLEEPKTFVFIQKLNKAGYYEMKGEDYSEKAYRTFCNKIEDKNRLLRTLSNKAEEDKVITIVYVKGKTIL